MLYQTEEEYRQAVLRARAMSPEEKFLEGGRLFEEECEQMKVEIRKEMPWICEEMVECELRSRLQLRREEEDRGIYINMPVGWVPLR
jgi:hypothetical protein